MGCGARQLNRIVGDESVTARNQLQRKFAFAQARFAGNEYAESEHIHEDAVYRGGRGESTTEVNA
jgi:hypothetical protein